MTKQDLIALIKDTAGPMVAELVETKTKQALEEQAEPSWAKKLFGQKSTTEDARAKGLGFGRVVRAIAMAKHEGGGFDGVLRTLKGWGDADLADGMVQAKALSQSSAPAGGYLVPIQQSAEIIDLRRNKTVIRGSGVREIPLPGGNLQVPKLTAGVAGSYIGENENIGVEQPTFGEVSLSAKKLAVMVPISNDLIRNSSPQADALVRDDIVRGLSVTEDAKLLRSQGGDKSPKGLRYLAASGNLIEAQSASLANVATDIGRMMQKLMEANVPDGPWTLIWSPRTWRYLYTLQTTTGDFAFKDEMDRGMFFGFRFKTTVQVPNTVTVGANADCSEIYLFNPDDQVIGDNLNLSIDVSQEAAYHDGNGVVAAFSKDQTVIRAISEHDFNTRYASSISVATGVRWGA